MSTIPVVGLKLLNKTIPAEHFEQYSVEIVRNLDQYQQVATIRAAVFMAEQNCPFGEEFDGNDLTATHLVGYDGGRPIGTLRLRWFAGFAKLERVCVLAPYRRSPIVKIMLANCFELAARKGYEMMIGHIQTRLVDLWAHVFSFKMRTGRPPVSFSNFDYTEIDIPLPKHPDAIAADEDAYVIIRPEGAWDDTGILENSCDVHEATDEAA